MLERVLGLLNGSARFSSLENLIFSTVRDKLPKDSLCVWDRQVAAINKIQRLPDGREVDFYRIKSGKPSFNLDLAFQSAEEELLLVIIKIIAHTSDTFLLARLWCVKGFIFSIEYDVSVNDFEKTTKGKIIKSELLYIGSI